MKRFWFVLLIVFSVVAHSRPRPESQTAMFLRSEESLQASKDRLANRYAENRQRCESALRIAKLCGKYAGTFSCDEKGFRSIPEAARARQISRSRFEVDRCAAEQSR